MSADNKKELYSALDPNIDRVDLFNNFYLKSTKTLNGPAPSIVEFDLHGSCSRRCAFCPRVDSKKWPNLKESFTTNLYIKILKELKEQFNYKGRIAWSGYSEPMMHSKIFSFCKLTKKYLPKCTLEMVSNGDFLNKKVIKKLFEFGLDHLRVSIYTNYKTSEKFKKIRDELEIDKNSFYIRERNKGKKNNFGLVLNNRGGAVNLKKIGIKKINKFPLKKSCNYPLYKLFVNYNGNYQVCSNDWNKKKIIGNAHKNSVFEIWYNEDFMNLRKNLLIKNRNLDPCKTCDVIGDLNGNNYAVAWKKFF